MCTVMVPAFIAFFLAEVSGAPGEMFSAVRRLSAQQYMEDYNLLAPEHGPPLVAGWHTTVRPPFSWDFAPAETKKPELISVSGIPVHTSSYFTSRHGTDKTDSFTSPANEKSTVDKRRERERKPNIREAHGSGVVTTKPNIREAHGAGVATRKPKKQKGKKSRAKNPRNELKLPSSCTDAAGGHSQSKLCEAQRRQIKKQRAQRRKRRRHMKELRRERQRKERQRRKQEKLPAVGGEVRDKFFSFEHVGNRSRHGFVLTSTSNSSVGLPEGNSLGSSSESNLKPRRRDAVDNAKITNEISDTAVNVGNSDRPNETTYVENTAASADLVGSHGKGRADTPYTNRASATEDPVNSNSRTETTYVERNATSVHPVRQPSEVPTGSSNSIAASMTEDPVQGRGPEAVTTEPTTEGAKVASGGPTTSSPGASLAGEHEDLSRLNRVDVSGPLLGSERGDLSCVVGHFLPAPAIKHADVKYIRSGDSTEGTLVARYECQLGYRLERVAAYRLWCSQRSWRGEVPHCVPSGEELSELDNSPHCAECDQVCHQEPGQPPLCSCYRGFHLHNATTCLDINECNDANGGCENECVNTAGAYFCKCPQGFRVDLKGKICRDINECLLRNGHGPCQDTCTNLRGEYTCSCEGIPGTRLSADNHTCDDVDECAAGTAGCSHTCLNTLGRVFCLCPPGFELGPDWKTCQDVDECKDPQLQGDVCEAVCVNTVGSYLCRSPGDQPADENCSDSGLCSLRGSNTTERAQKCPGGLRPGEDLQCEDVDECGVDNGGCAHVCVNTWGGSHCRCKPGFALDVDAKNCIEAAGAPVCPPLETPTHGYLQCERQLITVRRPRYSSRRRVVNHAGTVCRLRCPLGSGLRGAYRRTCTTAGSWTGPHHGVCLRFMVPTIKCPENVTALLPPGQRTTHVVFDQPFSSVDWFRHVVSEPLWGKQLEGDLPAGEWTVIFTARHPVSHLAASCTLAITVSKG